MKFTPALTSLLLTTCVISAPLPVASLASPALAAVPAAPANAEAGRMLLNTVRAIVQRNPALADGVGDYALLQGVREASLARPDLTEQIKATAMKLRPQLSPYIHKAAAGTVYAPPAAVAAPVAPVPAPPVAAPASAGAMGAGSAAAGSGSFFGTALGGHALAGLAAVSAAAVGVAAATGGGGSGESGGGGSGGGGSTVFPPSHYETQEYGNQWGLAAIKASEAYARGATGYGITVAVADTGLNTTHPEMSGQIAPNGYNFYDNNTNVTDLEGHGSHVSGIIAAKRTGSEDANNMHGVAYEAKVLPLKILGPLGGTVLDISDAVDHAIAQGAHVYNGSYGPSYDDPFDVLQIIDMATEYEADAYQRAVDSGMIMVFAAGNDYDDNPTLNVNPTGGGILPYIKPANAGSGVYDDGGANYDFSALEGMLIAVVSTESGGAIAPYSNRCGVAAAWCMAAPGSAITSIVHTNAYAQGSGTSMAAPHVSGAVALLLDLFPELTPQEVVQRLFISANKTGIYANASIYGQGFLDLEKATRPIGTLSVKTGVSVDGGQVALSNTSLRLGGAFGDGLKAALVGTKLAVFDDQNATFMVDLADFARHADSRFDMDEALRRFRSRFGAQTVTIGENATLHYTQVSLGQHEQEVMDPSHDPRGAGMELAYRQQVGDMQLSMNYNINPGLMFGIHQSGEHDAQALLTRDAFSAPYLSLVKQGYSFGSRVPLGDNLALGMAAFQGHPQAEALLEPEKRAESYGHMAELGYNDGVLKVFSQAGLLVEKNSFLGSRADGAFDLESGAKTGFVGMNAAYRLTPKWQLVGSYYYGISSPELGRNSLFTRMSNVQTEAFSLGMLGQDMFRKGDTLGLIGNQPMRVTGGEASLSLATGRTGGGMLHRQHYDVNLAPTGRELNLEAFYHMAMPGSGTQLMSALMYRSEPGHIEEAPDEGLFLMQLQQEF